MNKSVQTSALVLCFIAFASVTALKMWSGNGFNQGWYKFVHAASTFDNDVGTDSISVFREEAPLSAEVTATEITEWQEIVSRLTVDSDRRIFTLKEHRPALWQAINDSDTGRVEFIEDLQTGDNVFYQGVGLTLRSQKTPVSVLLDRLRYEVGIKDVDDNQWFFVIPWNMSHLDVRKHLATLSAQKLGQVSSLSTPLEPWLSVAIFMLVALGIATSQVQRVSLPLGLICLVSFAVSCTALIQWHELLDLGAVALWTAAGSVAIFVTSWASRTRIQLRNAKLVGQYLASNSSWSTKKFWGQLVNNKDHNIIRSLTIAPVSTVDYRSPLLDGDEAPGELDFLHDLTERCRDSSALVVRQDNCVVVMFAADDEQSYNNLSGAPCDMAKQILCHIRDELHAADNAYSGILPVKMAVSTGTVVFDTYERDEDLGKTKTELRVSGPTHHLATSIVPSCELFRILLTETAYSGFLADEETKKQIVPLAGLKNEEGAALKVFEWNPLSSSYAQLQEINTKINSWIGRERLHERWNTAAQKLRVRCQGKQGWLLNFSRTGFLIQWPAQQANGTTLKITIASSDGEIERVCEEEDIDTITVEVMRGGHYKKGTYYMGVRILDLDDAKLDPIFESLIQYVEKSQVAKTA